MTGELVGAADIITGAVVARAVEPGAGEGTGDAQGNCLNCGTALIGAYCHACGQTSHVHRTLHAFGHDFLHSVLHFDGKIWRTLPLLFWRPGDLTRRYIHGERAKFVSPLALFLFTVFLAFAAFNWMAPNNINTNKAVTADSAQREKLDVKLTGNAAGALAKGDNQPAEWNFTSLKFPGSNSLNKGMRHASENPQLLIYKVQSNAYKYSWALIPISVPFVWLLFFWRWRFKMFDHAVFVTYSLTFMMLLGVVCAILIQFPATEVIGGLALAFLPPIHMYRQLHHAYQTSRFGAFWRMCILSVFAMTALILFAVMIVTLGVTG